MSSDPGFDLDALTRTALRMADAAAQVTLSHFRSNGLSTLNKSDTGFDPVTAADRGAEEAMRAVLAQERPADAIFGEEGERIEGETGFTWVLDPIDGTRAFISGVPVWGTLIGLDDGSRGVIGIIDQPFTGERYLGTLGGAPRAELRHGGRARAISTRACAGLAEATLFTTDPYMFADAEADAFAALRRAVRLARYGTDCYAYALLASGHVDLVVESGLQAYDVASHIPLIAAAGGIITDWQGGDCRWGGRVVAAGDRRTHAAVLDILSRVP